MADEWERLKKLASGDIPDEVLINAGKATLASMNHRIRIDQKTKNGDKIDLPSKRWLDVKAHRGMIGAGLALVAEGSLTDGLRAWEFNTKDGNICEAILKGDEQEKWQELHEIAEDTGRNWAEALDLSPADLVIYSQYITNYILKELGDESKPKYDNSDIDIEV